MIKLIVLALALPLGMCVTDTREVIKTVTVAVPTPVSCVPKDFKGKPANPAPAEALKAAGVAEQYAMLARFWTVYSPWVDEADAVIESCRQAGPPP